MVTNDNGSQEYELPQVIYATGFNYNEVIVMFQCCNMKFSDMRNKIVYDSKGEKIGKIIDFIFDFTDNKIVLKSVVLGGSRKEEFLEAIGLRPDDDPIFQVDCIDRMEEDIHLGVPKESLKSTLDKDAIGEGHMKLSTVTKLPVIDADDIKIGNVIDVWFDAADQPLLVIGGGFVEETLERLGLQPNIDLLVPQHVIADIDSERIRLKWTKFQLRSNCESEYERTKREVASRHGTKDARAEVMRLTGYSHRAQ